MALADEVKTAIALDPTDRYPSAAEFDNALALRQRAPRFAPVPAHDGHVRCWTAVGKGADLMVCAIQG